MHFVFARTSRSPLDQGFVALDIIRGHGLRANRYQIATDLNMFAMGHGLRQRPRSRLVHTREALSAVSNADATSSRSRQHSDGTISNFETSMCGTHTRLQRDRHFETSEASFTRPISLILGIVSRRSLHFGYEGTSVELSRALRDSLKRVEPTATIGVRRHLSFEIA